MKKNNLLLFIFLFATAATSHAQIKFESLSLQKAISKAKKENKLIFLQLQSADCNQCNAVADKAFEASFPDRLKNYFIFIKLPAFNPDRAAIDKQFSANNLAGTLFLDADGNLIHRYNGTTTRIDSYIEQSDIAIQKYKGAEKILVLQKAYESDKNNIDALEKYIFKRNELNLEVDSLLDKYALQISPDSLKSFRVLQFIASNAPLIGSKAESILHKENDLFVQAWYKLPLTQRININHKIVSKSQQKAIETKNINYLYRVANFVKAVNTPDFAAKNAEKVLLDYYRGVSDTVNFISSAINYYDKYLMTVSVDSIKINDSLRLLTMFKTAVPFDTLDLGEGTGIKTFKKRVAFSPQSQVYANELNAGAWKLYEMSNTIQDLKKATEWAKRATEFYDAAEVMDTYARLLYKTDNKDEAMNWEKKAIDLVKKRNFSSEEYERVLKRMKSNAVIIDDK